MWLILIPVSILYMLVTGAGNTTMVREMENKGAGIETARIAKEKYNVLMETTDEVCMKEAIVSLIEKAANIDFLCLEESGDPEPPDYEEIQEELLSQYDFSGMDQLLQEFGGMESGTFEDLVRSLMGGDIRLPDHEESRWQQFFYQVVLTELDENRDIMLKLLLLSIMTALYSNLGTSVGQGGVSENGFYVTYLCMTMLLMSSYSLMYQIAWSTVNDIIRIVKALLPAYIAAVGISSGVTSSVVMEEGLVLGITAAQDVVKQGVFPMIQVYVALEMVNNLMEQDYFSKLSDLLKTLVNWVLKSVLAVVVGINAVKGMLSPAVDSVTATALNRGVEVIPGGEVVQAVSGVVISSGILIKNAIGAGGILVLVSAVLLPVLKLTVCVLLYKLMAAILQPVADPRMLKGMNSVSTAGQLLISTVLTVIVLFMVTIAIIAVSANARY